MDTAAYDSIRTVYFGLDTLRKYIRLSPFTNNNIPLAAVLFNVVLEFVDLPCLNIDFGGEEWAWYTLKAVEGDLNPILGKVMKLLVRRLYDTYP